MEGQGGGFVGSVTVGGVANAFMALGPIPAGYVIERIELTVTADGEATPQVAAVGVALSNSPALNQAAFEAAQQLVQTSLTTLFGKPVLSFPFKTGGTAHFSLHPGVVVLGGGVWVLIVLSNVSAAANSACNASVKVLKGES